MKNGKDLTPRQRRTAQIRARIMKRAYRNGGITNEEAKKAAGLPQVWFHLMALVEDKRLWHAGYNLWKPMRGRPRRT